MLPRLQTVSARLREDGAALGPALVLLAVVVAWAASGGGYESQAGLSGYNPDPWYLGALALVALLVATVAALGRVRISRAAAFALAALTAYTLWSFASTTWASDPGTALRGSDRTLVYLAAFALFAILPWTPRALRTAFSMFIAGFGVLALVTAVRVAGDGDPTPLYIYNRLSYPLGYYNADAAMFMTTAMAAVALAARRSAPAALRPVALAIGGLGLQLALLSQSRGWLFTVPVVLIVALLAIPNRLRLVATALGPALATAAAAPALLDVYSKANNGGVQLAPARLAMVLHERGQHAVRVALVADLVLMAAGAVAVIWDRRVQLSERAERRIQRASVVATVAIVLAGLAAGLIATHAHPVRRIESAWNSFDTTVSFNSAGAAPTAASRFTSLSSQRVDIWRVALRETGRHPLLGIGQDNFADSYLAHRRSDQEPRWAHSIELRLLVHSGIVGFLLFGAFVVAALLAALRGTRNDRARRVAAGLALVPLIVWLVHGSVDWFWEFPALSVPALAFLGAATALGQRRREATARPLERRRRAIATIAGVLVAALALAAIAVPYLAARQVQRSIDAWPSNPALAFRELRSASDIVSFDAQTYLVGAAIALNLGADQDAGAWLAAAARHDPHAWLPPLLLGVIANERGDTATARAEFLRAKPLDPAEPLITAGLARAGSRQPLTFADVQASLGERTRARFGR